MIDSDDIKNTLRKENIKVELYSTYNNVANLSVVVFVALLVEIVVVVVDLSFAIVAIVQRCSFNCSLSCSIVRIVCVCVCVCEYQKNKIK
jgi:hypothetical protein